MVGLHTMRWRIPIVLALATALAEVGQLGCRGREPQRPAGPLVKAATRPDATIVFHDACDAVGPFASLEAFCSSFLKPCPVPVPVGRSQPGRRPLLRHVVSVESARRTLLGGTLESCS